MYKVIIKNLLGRSRTIPKYNDHYFYEIGGSGKITIENLKKEEAEYYSRFYKYDFEVEVESPEEEKPVEEEVGEKVLKEEIKLDVKGFKSEVILEPLELKLEKKTSEELRDLAKGVGINPRSLKNKEKLVELLLEDEGRRVEIDKLMNQGE